MTRSNFLIAKFNDFRLLNPDGFTMNIWGDVYHSNFGFSVGVESCQTIDEAVAKRSIGQSFGYWKDQDGIEYIDLVKIVSTLEEAMEIALIYSQKAIYSFVDQKVIDVPYDVFDYWPRMNLDAMTEQEIQSFYGKHGDWPNARP